jgi:L,D-peptidoglycan transpeptidase YkuD (ErfK/YbiS/YcfS/YnhG family)
MVAKKPLKPVLKRSLRRLTATLAPTQGRARQFGRLHAGPIVIRCALGGGGIRRDKREGDHATPAGQFRLIAGLYRPGQVLNRSALLPMQQIQSTDGWCDDPDSALYNRPVALPCRQSHENLWRGDSLYDIVIVLNYNLYPRRKNRGSAIFIHCAHPGYTPTEGCVALRKDDLRRLLPRLSRNTVLTIRQ